MRLLVGAIVVLAVGLWAAFVASRAVPRYRSNLRDVHGAYHVHSTFSDGWGTVDEIINAAAYDELSFVVLSDHNVLHPELRSIRQGVLLIPATEESTGHGHVVSLEASRALTDDEKRPEQDALMEIRSLGGWPLLAHPFNRRNPFTDWTRVDGAQGLETLSFDDFWREALHEPLGRGLFETALEYLPNPKLALGQMVRRPRTELMRYDELRGRLQLSQLCAVDAHGIPGYAPMLAMMSMHIDGIEAPLTEADAPRIARALAEGRAYCGVDFLGDAAGFRFWVESPSGTLTEGMTGNAFSTLEVRLPPVEPPPPARIHLFRDGVEVATTGGPGLILPAQQVRPGDYRVEVDLPLPGAFWDGPRIPWLVSNSIRLR